jgi:hypothetical protein
MAEQPKYESQKERWIKYGANVALASVVVIVLAGLIIYIAQRTNRRIDTTASGAYSLKPQTLNIINDLKGKTKIVSLYQQSTPQQGADKMDYAQPVMDLLDEYRRKGKNIEVDAIDPVANPSKVDDLITEVTNRYGGEVKKYKEVLDAYPKVYEQLKNIATGEVEKIAKLPLDSLGEDDDSQMTRAALVTIRSFPKRLESSRESIERKKGQKPPDYKGATGSVETSAEDFSQISTQVIEIFNKSKANAKLAEPIRKYMADATPVYTQIKKISDDLLKQTKELGDLKLDDLRQSLRARDAILVMGESDMRVIPFEQVWKADDQQLKQYVPGQELKPRFAGEQQISTAILALTQQKKPKVVFVRAGGAPLAQGGMGPFARGGPMSQVADRLRQYNFEVLEKDLSGMWAMQAQMQQMPAAPEPTDEQIKDAIWIVLAFPTGQQSQMGPPPAIGPKVSAHLKDGGSAMLIFAPQVDNMGDVLKDWGIEVRSDAVAVHDPIKPTEGRQVDAIEDAQRYAFVFDIKNYGDHLITKPLASLSSWLVPAMAVKPTAQAPAGVKVTPILPLPTEPRSWGETDLEALQNQSAIQFDEGKDVAGPLYAGAVAEKEKGGRLVVIASPMFAFDRYVNEPDPTLLRRGMIVSRFPANGELFNNSVFWLAKMEPMIAISPAAMEVARIEPMGTGALRFWRVGVLLVALPAAVMVAGALVYFARRD